MGNTMYVHIVFPLALPKLYTYSIPEELQIQIKIGCRVEVELRNKHYSGIVYSIFESIENDIATKPISNIIDAEPIISSNQLKLWTWMAKYYCCSIGEVMEAGIPSGLKLNSESVISIADEDYEEMSSSLNDDEYLVAEALHLQKELTISQIQDILNKKSVYPILKSLLGKSILHIKEQLIEKYKPKSIRMVRLIVDEKSLETEIEKIEKYEHQYKTLLAIASYSQNSEWISIKEINNLYKSNSQVINSLAKKGFIEIKKKEVSRLNEKLISVEDLPKLNADQIYAIEKIKISFEEKKPVLIHGVTGSGKTRIYKELIHEALSKGKQILYLLPEIALTTQIVDRLLKIFGNDILLYHSKLGDYERVEIWNEVLKGKKLVLSARSGIFLPFTNLDLIIVDEEHDTSYKQNEPNPHYNARDVALYLAHQLKCNIILGSATPSVESYYNASIGMNNLVTLDKRFGEVKMPKIEIVDLGYERKTGRYKPVISVPLKKEIEKNLLAKKQVILFQNRRGYVPTIQCKNCGWTATCTNCDVNLTLHKFLNELSCHYCNQKRKPPMVCPDCQNHEVKEVGSGTEKIEAIASQLFPESKIGRLDLDTAKTKSSMDKIIGAFSIGEIDILIGTQMVTKGFDFDNVSLVGVVDADASLRIPDFRANERTYQLITQVAGRAGRRAEQGKVIIQTYSPKHPVIEEIIANDYNKFFNREINERKLFNFPPFNRIINVEFKHKDLDKVSKTAELFYTKIYSVIGDRVKGPIIPGISRIRNQYIRQLVIKLEKNNEFIFKTKQVLMKLKDDFNNEKDHRAVKIKFDVDPY